MNKTKIIVILAFAASGIWILLSDNPFMPTVGSFSTGPPPGHTAGPGEGTCTECHFANPGSGIFNIVAPSGYVPGQTYQIGVQHATSDVTRLRWGFQLTSLAEDTSFAGAFTDTSPFTQIDFGNSRFYIEHTETGTFSGTSGNAAWTFNWTAPATNVGPVTFYASGNQANNDSSPDGDQIYTASVVMQPVESSTPTATHTATPTSTPTSAATPSIAGTVTYANAVSPPKYISAVLVTGSGSPDVFAETGPPGATAGQYVLTGFGSGSYTVSLAKKTGQNGITSFDSARIAQHVAGVSPLSTDVQRVTADVSGNGSLTSNDAALIARFAAGLGPPMGNTNTWRFYVAPGPTFPVGSSPTTRTYSSVTGNLTGEDYVGLLIGEVSGNWIPSAVRNSNDCTECGETSDPAATITLPDLDAPAVGDIIVPVSIAFGDREDIISYEFDLKYDPSVIQPLEDVVDVKGTASRGLSSVVNSLEPGLLRVVLYGAMPIDNRSVLLNLRFRAVGMSGQFSSLIWERILLNEGQPVASAANGSIRLF